MRTQLVLVYATYISVLAVPVLGGSMQWARLDSYYAVDDGGKCGYIDAAGRYIIPAQYDRGYKFTNGLASVTVGYDTKFIDPTGKTVFSLPDRMRSFGLDERDDTAIVESRTGRGIIDRSGAIMVAPIFFKVRPFSGELYDDRPYADHSITVVALDDKRYAVIDRKGNILFGPRIGVISILTDGIFETWNPKTQAHEYFDRNFEALPDYQVKLYIRPAVDNKKFNQVNVWHDSKYAQAQLPNKEWNEGWGIINAKGEWVVPPIYSNLYFNDGPNELTFILARRDSKWGFIAISGKKVISFSFDKLLPFVGNYAPAAIESKWGLIDKSGQWKLKPAYDDVKELSDDAAAVRQGALWGVVDYKGRWLIEPRFRKVGECQGRAFTIAERMFEPEDSPRAKEYEEFFRGAIRAMDNANHKQKRSMGSE